MIINKPLLKFALWALALSIINMLIGLLVWWIWFSKDEWAVISYIAFYGYPSLALFVLSVVTTTAHFFYKGPVAQPVKIIGITICTICLIIPYALPLMSYWLSKDAREADYANWQRENSPEAQAIERERLESDALRRTCLEFKNYMLNRKASDPVWLKPTGCQ
ncbi:MAG: hypothetical protein V1690_03010 [Candidatus Moraniibacteriota bacterium]